MIERYGYTRGLTQGGKTAFLMLIETGSDF
jgi:hypothetical protein